MNIYLLCIHKYTHAYYSQCHYTVYSYPDIDTAIATTIATATATVTATGTATSTAIVLVSHCGEYHCECKKKYSRQIRQIVANIWRMGLRMQFDTNRNDRKMIARYS